MIVFNYNRAMQQAQRLDKAGGELRQICRRHITECQNDLAAAWSGEAANLFSQNCSELQAGLLGQAAELEKLAEKIRFRARALKQAEEAADALVQNDSGFGGGGTGGGRF